MMCVCWGLQLSGHEQAGTAGAESERLSVPKAQLIRALDGASDMLMGVVKLVGRVLSPWHTTGRQARMPAHPF